MESTIAAPNLIEPEVIAAETDTEIETHRRELREIEMMLEQSHQEVAKLTQRNASITAHVQQAQSHFDSLPRADIRMMYESALDAQQRLFVLRGQVEKMQSDQVHLKRHLEWLGKLQAVLESGGAPKGPRRPARATAEVVEMMIQAQEAERQRLSRQMHDGPAQALSNFILQTEIAARLFDMDLEKSRAELGNLKLSATTTFQKVRDFIFDLRPMMLDDLGLAPTLKRYVEVFKEPGGCEVRLSIVGNERRFESYQEVMVFRAIQELITNALRHSQASQVKVQLDLGDAQVKVVVEDNGKGFAVETLAEQSGMGLKVIRERVEMLGGYLDVDSLPGQGTRVTFQIPAE